MKIAAITRFKHGGLFSAMRKLELSARKLSDLSGVSYHSLLKIIALQIRPTEEQANKIQSALGELGLFFDVLEEWPESFCGFGKSIKIEQLREVDADKLVSNFETHAPEEIEILQEELLRLPPRERYVIEKHWGIDGDAIDCVAISRSMGFSRTRAHQLEESGIHKLRRRVKRRLEEMAS